MLSKDDYRNYLSQMASVEQMMHARYAEWAGRVEDPEVRKVFLQLAAEESAHEEIVNKDIRRLLINKAAL